MVGGVPPKDGAKYCPHLELFRGGIPDCHCDKFLPSEKRRWVGKGGEGISTSAASQRCMSSYALDPTDGKSSRKSNIMRYMLTLSGSSV